MKIEIIIPENIDDTHIGFYLKKKQYSIINTRTKNVRNVFVSHEGLCLKNGLLLKGCAFNLVGSEDYTFYFEHYKLVLEQFLVSKYGKSLESQNLHEGSYLLIHTRWFNYFFWLTSSLSRLINTIDQHQNVKLIYPENWENISYINDTLKMFPLLEKIIIPKGRHLFVKNLLFPEVRKWSIGINPEDIEKIRIFFYKYLDDNDIDINLGDKLYISRKKAKFRNIVNESEVWGILKEKGFREIILEDYSVIEQASILRNTSYLVGIHGAGFSNMLFMSPNSFVFELMKKFEAQKDERFSYWRLANACNLKYLVQFCQPKYDDTIKMSVNQDLIVDILQFKKNISQYCH